MFLLASSGAHVDVQDADGRTPGHWATYHGRPECLQLILAAGAALDIPDKDGASLFFVYCVCVGVCGCVCVCVCVCICLLVWLSARPRVCAAACLTNLLRLLWCLQVNACSHACVHAI